MTHCRQCAMQMKLVTASQDEEGLEDRIFECPKCRERDTLVFSSATSERSA
jgi:transcription initiation factor IIE alpha subunit